jgi:hypothetical protein
LTVTPLAAASGGLEVAGTVYVGGNVSLVANATYPVTATGVINVGYANGGTLKADVATATAIRSNVSIDGGTLAITGAVGTLSAAVGILPFVTKGILDVSAATYTMAPTASEVIEAVTEPVVLLGATKRLVIAAEGAEDQTTLSVPAWLDLFTGDDLGDVDTITVAADGGLILTAANGTVGEATGVTVTVAGELGIVGGATLALKDSSTPAASSVGATGTITVAATGKLSVVVGNELAIASGGVVALEDTGSLELNSAATTAGAGAKITGAGKVTAGKTEIVGGTGGWEAKISDNTTARAATIASVDADTASITGATDGVLVAGANATITQLAGSGNELQIKAVTAIDLKGVLAPNAVVGSIVLHESATPSAGGKVSFAAATSIIKVGNEANAVSAMSVAAGDFIAVGAATHGKISVSDFTYAEVFGGGTTASKLNAIQGTSTASSIQAFGGAGGTGTVSVDPSKAVS